MDNRNEVNFQNLTIKTIRIVKLHSLFNFFGKVGGRIVDANTGSFIAEPVLGQIAALAAAFYEAFRTNPNPDAMDLFTKMMSLTLGISLSNFVNCVLEVHLSGTGYTPSRALVFAPLITFVFMEMMEWGFRQEFANQARQLR